MPSATRLLVNEQSWPIALLAYRRFGAATQQRSKAALFMLGDGGPLRRPERDRTGTQSLFDDFWHRHVSIDGFVLQRLEQHWIHPDRIRDFLLGARRRKLFGRQRGH